MNLIRRPSSSASYRPRGTDDPFGRMVEDMFAPFTVGQGEGVATHLENGMLTLSLPKKQAGAATRVTVQ